MFSSAFNLVLAGMRGFSCALVQLLTVHSQPATLNSTSMST